MVSDLWNPAFKACLTRLVEYRGLSLSDLGDPSPDFEEFLRRAALALRLPPVDLFVLAGQPLPDELSPVDRLAGKEVDKLVRIALGLDDQARSRLLMTAQSVAVRRHIIDFHPIPYEVGPGSQVRSLLLARNLDHFTTAPVLKRMTGRYVAGSVIARIGMGYVKLTPEWLADLAAVLGISAALLSAITGLEVLEVTRDKAVIDSAELIWAVRRFTYDQVQALIATAVGGK